MTTDPKIEYVFDCYADNEVFNLPRASLNACQDLGCISWVQKTTTLAASQHACFLAAVRSALDLRPSYCVWLLATHSTWQPDNRLTRHQRLWSSLRLRELSIPDGRFLREHMQSEATGLKWRSAVQIEFGSVPNAVEIVRTERSCLVLALPHGSDALIENLIENGWEDAIVGPSPSVLGTIIPKRGIVFHSVGAFDDAEVGAVAFASSDNIDGWRRFLGL